MRITSKKIQGFTLLEILVALTCLAGGILGIAAVFSLSVRSASHSMNQHRAADIAECEMERAMLHFSKTTRSHEGQSDRYRWTIDFQPSDLGLMQITAQVTWQEQGTPQSFNLQRVFLSENYDRGGK